MACRRSSVRPRYAPPDLTEKAKRIRASPFLLNLPRRSSGAALARHPTERSRAIAPAVFPRPSKLAKRIRASPFLLNLPRRSSGAAPARHPKERSRAIPPDYPRPSKLAKRIRASPFLFNLPRRSSGPRLRGIQRNEAGQLPPGSSLFQAGVRTPAQGFRPQRFRHWSCGDRDRGIHVGRPFCV